MLTQDHLDADTHRHDPAAAVDRHPPTPSQGDGHGHDHDYGGGDPRRRQRSPGQPDSPHDTSCTPGLDAEQQLQMTNANKFTPSCARCRQKKLRCDTKLPCNQCTAKRLQNECRKDQRIPRGRKRLKRDGPQQPQQDEISALKRRIKELEQLVERQDSPGPSRSDHSLQPFQDPHLVSSSSSLSLHHKNTNTITASGHSSSWPSGPSQLGQPGSRPTSPYADVEEPPGETESTVALLEKLAASDPRLGEPGHGRAATKKINDPRSAQIGEDAPNAYFRGPHAFRERVEILELAKRLLPDRMVVDELVNTFSVRCHHLVGHVIHMPTFRNDVDLFSSIGVADILTSHLDMFDLARYLMVLRLGMRFYPWRGALNARPSRPEFVATDALKNRGDDISQKWYQLAKRALAADRSFALGSLKAVQAALLMILDGRDSPTYLRMLLRISIQTALDMGLHRLGGAMPRLNDFSEDLVRIETGVRIWWYLVVKDWCSAQREGAYTIHPAQSTTRLPLHTKDDLLSRGVQEGLPADEFTEMSYVLSQIALAHLIRESIDLRNEQTRYGGTYAVMTPTNRKRMQAKLESFLGEDLPSFFRLECCRMDPGVLSVQRGLLHQQTFDFLLKLNRKDLASPYGRASLTALAEQIISTQRRLRSICPVIDGFWINFYHLFGATLTLTVPLLLGDGDGDGQGATTRDARRAKVEAALTTMREAPGSDRGSRIIETLLEEEEAAWQQRRRGDRPRQDSEKHLAALARRLLSRTAELEPSSGVSVGSGVGSDAPLEVGPAPEESIIPSFCSPHGDVDGEIPILLQQAMIAAESQPGNVVRPYEHSLHPWNEPPRQHPWPAPHDAVTSWQQQQQQQQSHAHAHRQAEGGDPPALWSPSFTFGNGSSSSSNRPLPFHLIEEQQQRFAHRQYQHQLNSLNVVPDGPADDVQGYSDGGTGGNGDGARHHPAHPEAPRGNGVGSGDGPGMNAAFAPATFFGTGHASAVGNMAPTVAPAAPALFPADVHLTEAMLLDWALQQGSLNFGLPGWNNDYSSICSIPRQ